jgi:hypothetical protein
MIDQEIKKGELIQYVGLAAVDVDSDGKKRFKVPARQADWAAMIKQLMDLGMGYQEMSDLTGFPVNTLKSIKAERQGNEIGDRSLMLLGLYTMNIGTDVPLLGDYHEIGKDKAA